MHDHYILVIRPQKTRHSEAESWFSKARALAPDDREVHLHYGMFLLDADRNSEAAQHFVLAAEAADGGDGGEHAYEATFNAAVAFRYVGASGLFRSSHLLCTETSKKKLQETKDI